MDFEPSPRSAEYRDRVSAFIDELILPLEARFFAAFGENHGARGPDSSRTGGGGGDGDGERGSLGRRPG